MKLPLLAAALLFAQSPADQLFDAARAGDSARVRTLLDQGADANAKGPYEQTPLFFAADRGHLEVVRILVARGARVNLNESFYGMTPLARALMKQRLDVVAFLLANGADGAAPMLAQAAAAGDAKLARIVLDAGKLSASDLATSLALAQRKKHDPVAEMLTKAGAQPLAPATFKVDPDILRSYAGVYTGGRGGSEFDVEITPTEGKLKLTFSGRPNSDIVAAVSATEFRNDESLQSIEFRIESGAVTGFLAKPFANQFFRRKK